jgi:hypothetical protein
MYINKSLKIPKRYSENINRRRTVNTRIKRKRIEEETMIYIQCNTNTEDYRPSNTNLTKKQR